MNEREKQLDKLRNDLLKAMRSGNMVKAANIQMQMNRLQYEQISLQTAALESMTIDEHVEAINLMNRVFVLGDLIEEAALDLEAHMRKTGVVKISICKDARQIKLLAGKFAKLVDGYHDEEFSDSFAELCESIRMSVKNAMYKQEAKLRPIIEKAHDKN